MHDRQFAEFDPDAEAYFAALERERTLRAFNSDAELKRLRAVNRAVTGCCGDCSDCGPRYIVPEDPKIRVTFTQADFTQAVICVDCGESVARTSGDQALTICRTCSDRRKYGLTSSTSGTGNDSTFECDREVSGSCAGVCSDYGPRYIVPKDPSIRTFETGATRDADEGKYDYEGFFSPLVLRERAAYMDRHRVQSDGTLRASDNWQQGIPLDQYTKSAFRHFVEWWTLHRDYDNSADIREAICALMFNAEGYLFELLRSEED